MKNKSDIFSSPAEGNAFGLAMQKTGGDYKAAKAMMDSAPINYGSGSPFQLKKSKTFSPSDNTEVDPTKYAERRKKSINKQKRERQFTLDSSGDTYTHHTTGRRYRVGTGPNPNLG
tara:strand:+ start:1032 stop:1379 length:348 start_codon:yes stop_codon:yes gene_type:complete